MDDELPDRLDDRPQRRVDACSLLYPVPRNPHLDTTGREHGTGVIDPRFGFGRPVIDGTGIRTEVVIERFSAGEPLEALAEDYGRPKEDIEEVLRSELQLAA